MSSSGDVGGTRRVTVGRLALAAVAVAAAAMAVSSLGFGGTDEPDRQTFRGPIAPYLHRSGGREVEVPNGRYRGGTITAPHDEWLVLRAETPGGVVVDLRETGLQLEEGTSKIVFVGFRFVDGMVRLAGVDSVNFWYCEFTSPPEAWQEQFRAAGGPDEAPRAERGKYIRDLPNPLPTAIRLTGGSGARPRRSRSVGIYGSDIHDVGDDALYVVHADGVRLAGLRIWDVDERGIDPGRAFGNSGDWFHNDGIQTTGSLSDFELTDSWVGEKIQWAADGQDVTNVRFRRLWLAGSRTFGQINGISGRGRILDMTIDDVRAFANGQGDGTYLEETDTVRTDFVDGRQIAIWPRTHHAPGRFEIAMSGTDDAVPGGVVVADGLLSDIAQVREHDDNPANRWRAEHPYDAYRRYLELP